MVPRKAIFIFFLTGVVVINTLLYGLCCGRYNARSDCLIVEHHSPVVFTGRLRACKDKARGHDDIECHRYRLVNTVIKVSA